MTALLLLTLLAIQETPSPMQAVSPHFTVDVLDRGSDEAGARLMVTRKDTTRYHIVTLNRALGRVRSVRLRNDEGRVIAITERGFAVIEPVGRAPHDEVYGFGPTASGDARWIAYMRALRDEENSDAGDGIVMYDTTRTPDQNREAFPIAMERLSAAGWPVYPPGTGWKKSSGMEPQRPHSGAYQWWNEPLYLAALRTSASERLVVADVSQPGMRVCTKVLPLDSERWRDRGNVTFRRLADGGYSVEIKSAAGGTPPQTIVFPANCGLE